MKWLLLSVNQGNLESQFNIGITYHKGEGVEIDYKEAMKWYLLSANQGEIYSITSVLCIIKVKE